MAKETSKAVPAVPDGTPLVEKFNGQAAEGGDAHGSGRLAASCQKGRGNAHALGDVVQADNQRR